MRIRTALPAIVSAVVIGLSSIALADKDEVEIKTHKDEVKVKTHEERHVSDRDYGERWDRGEWTRHEMTSRERPAIRTRTVERERVTVAPRHIEGGMATRHFSGPYRYFFTDAEGKYNYYLDRYSYPYRYGGTEIDLPVGVLGDVPPGYLGGGPVRYFREERPLSQSVYDR